MGSTPSREDLLIVNILKILKKLVIGGIEVTASASEINSLHGITANVDELNLLDLSAVGGLVKVKKIHVAAGNWSTETDSGFDLPAKAVLKDIFFDVTTSQAGKTVDVGLLSSESGGDADGFAKGVSLAATGIIRPGFALDGGNAYYNTNTRGALLSKFVQGAGTDDRGLYSETNHPSTGVTAKSVSYTTNTTVTAVFDIYLIYVELG